MRIIGIDPGVSGAAAIIGENGAMLAITDMPTVLANKSSNRQMVNAYALAATLREWMSTHGPCVAITENVNTMPEQGIASSGAFMKSYGMILGVVAALGISMEIVSPQRWKKHFALSRDKDSARELAQRMFPAAPLNLKKHHNRAEALLLAKYYRERCMPRNDGAPF